MTPGGAAARLPAPPGHQEGGRMSKRMKYRPGANHRPRGWHRGVGQDALWEAAAARLDAARLAEGLEDPRAVADPVVAGVAAESHDVRERRGAPTRTTAQPRGEALTCLRT
jgi:hypothetical protein